MRPLIATAFAVIVTGCASSIPDVAPVSTSASHMTMCVNNFRPAASQQAEEMAARHCSQRGLVQRAVSQGACPPSATWAHGALSVVRYECHRL